MCSRWFLDSDREDIENIAFSVLFRATRITLHCPIHGSSLSNCHYMGCRRWFVVSRFEVLFDEDDVRSCSRALERGNFLRLAQLHVAVLTLWSQCLLLDLSERTCWLLTHGSHRSCLICVYIFVCVFVFVYKFNRHCHNSGWMVVHPQVSPFLSLCFRDQARHLFRSPEWTNLMVAHSRVSPFLLVGFWFWLHSLGVFTASSNFWIQFFHLIIFRGNPWRRSRWHIYIYFFSYMISPDSITTTFEIQ